MPIIINDGISFGLDLGVRWGLDSYAKRVDNIILIYPYPQRNDLQPIEIPSEDLISMEDLYIIIKKLSVWGWFSNYHIEALKRLIH